MTLTIELSPQAEQELLITAQANHLTLAEYIHQILEREAQEDAQDRATIDEYSASNGHNTHERRVLSGYGKFAGQGSTVDEFLKERHAEAKAEAKREEARYQNRHTASLSAGEQAA